MFRTRIKICGVTRAQDALVAAQAGADAIGLIFQPGAKRRVSIVEAQAILDGLPPAVTTVGLFVDAEVSRVMSVVREVHLECAQLHGNESPEFVEALRPVPVIKAVRVTRDGIRDELRRWAEAIRRLSLTHLRGIVLETAVDGQAGGTGVSNDWDTIAHCAEAHLFEGLPSIIVAGGLTPQNVGDVVRRLRPWAVDVSSGVEGAPRRKSALKIAEFIRAVRSADQE